MINVENDIFDKVCHEACRSLRARKACDMRCQDGRGRCSNFLLYVAGRTDMAMSGVLEEWANRNNYTIDNSFNRHYID